MTQLVPLAASSVWVWLRCALLHSHLQGNYVALACEPVCLCGVDVAAPNQIRRREGKSFLQSLADLKGELSEGEVSNQLWACTHIHMLHAICCVPVLHPGPAGLYELHCLCDKLDVQGFSRSLSDRIYTDSIRIRPNFDSAPVIYKKAYGAGLLMPLPLSSPWI